MGHKYNTYPLPCGCAVEFIEGGWFELPKARWVISCNLHAAAPLMLQVLKMVEWKQNSNDDTVCPWCEWEWNTHHPDCPRQAAIATATKEVNENDPEMLMTEDVEQKFDGQWMHGDANDILQVVVGQLDEARREIKRLNNLRVLLLEAVKNVILGHVIQYTRGMEELCAAIAAAEKEEHNGQHL